VPQREQRSQPLVPGHSLRFGGLCCDCLVCSHKVHWVPCSLETCMVNTIGRRRFLIRDVEAGRG
jgi:hypothetical protein